MPPFKRRRKDKAPRDEDLTAPLDPPTVQPTAPAAEPIAVSTSASVSDVSGVAEVVGPTVVPQITVGSPSPAVEPSAIATGYYSLPFRPDVVIDGWSTDALTVRGVSQRGHLHRYNGAPRQDDFALHHLPDGRVIILVADGVSGAPQSHIGASTAIKQAAEWLHSHLGDDVANTDWLALLKSTAWALNERAQTLLGLEAPDPVSAEEQLATTLACAVIEPTGARTLRAYLVSAGDSVAWLLSAGQFVEILAGKTVPASGIASSAVVGLPRVPTEVTPIVIEIADNDVLLIATDGIGDPLGAGQGGVGDLFREVLTKPSAPSLIEFAHAVDFSRETFDDDRTLVAVWPRITVSPKTGRHSREPDRVGGVEGL
ncbi:MAG: protein phosphatase 2C domain-containing protein [Mycobacterium sp.]